MAGERQAFYTAEVEKLRKEIDGIEYGLANLRALHQTTAHVGGRLDSLTEEERAEVVNLVCQKVVVSGDEIIVHLAIVDKVTLSTSTR